jgi:hypothetical protein
MDEPGGKSEHDSHATPELREAVRAQIVTHGLVDSRAIAAELDVRHATVVRLLQRFAAVGALALVPAPTATIGAVAVVPGSLSDRFRDLTAPLW